MRPEDVGAGFEAPTAPGTGAERDVALAVLRLPDVISAAAESRAPHTVCAYLEATAGLVNAWYHQGNLDPQLRILADVPDRSARIRLARAVQITLRNGLRALGLSAPETLSRAPA
ncbi:DALR anticodon-binding domain-containing protein [Candidatus Palauibacter sp.]